MPSCELSDKDRELVLSILREVAEEVPEVQSAIDALATCQPCSQTMKITGTAKPVDVAKSGRKLSNYQIFMGECMRPPEKGGRGQPMTTCVEEWREKKKAGQTTEGQVM